MYGTGNGRKEDSNQGMDVANVRPGLCSGIGGVRLVPNTYHPALSS
jgi:hypothetical protein